MVTLAKTKNENFMKLTNYSKMKNKITRLQWISCAPNSARETRMLKIVLR